MHVDLKNDDLCNLQEFSQSNMAYSYPPNMHIHTTMVCTMESGWRPKRRGCYLASVTDRTDNVPGAADRCGEPFRSQRIARSPLSMDIRLLVEDARYEEFQAT
jgi:hypothetical protein